MTADLIERLRDEADLCRSETADDIARLLDEAASALAAQPRCVCGEPTSAGVVHRTDGPCYMAAPSPAEGDVLRQALERIADPRNTHFAGDAQVVAREALAANSQRKKATKIDYRAECWPESPHAVSASAIPDTQPKGLTSVCHIECDGCLDAGKCAFPGKPAEPVRYPHPDEDDAVTLWAEIHRLRAAVQGPDGYATWQEAATAERVRRVAAEKALAAAQAPAPAPMTDAEMTSAWHSIGEWLSSESAFRRGIRLAESRSPAVKADDARDAARWRWLCDTLHGAVGGGVEVNDQKLVYEDAEPGEAVRVFWYPNTPVGFYEVKADKLADAVDAAMAAHPPVQPMGDANG